MRRILLGAAFVAVVLLLLGWAALKNNGTSPSGTGELEGSTVATTTTSPSVQDAVQQYRSDRYGFEFQYPAAFVRIKDFSDSDASPTSPSSYIALSLFTTPESARPSEPLDCGGRPLEGTSVSISLVHPNGPGAPVSRAAASDARYQSVVVGGKTLLAHYRVGSMCGDTDNFLWERPDGGWVWFGVAPAGTPLSSYERMIESFRIIR